MSIRALPFPGGRRPSRQSRGGPSRPCRFGTRPARRTPLSCTAFILVVFWLAATAAPAAASPGATQPLISPELGLDLPAQSISLGDRPAIGSSSTQHLVTWVDSRAL